MRSNGRERKGSVYLAVMGSAMIVMILGLLAASIARTEARLAIINADNAQAQLYARSAVEMGLHYINTVPNWRQASPNSWVVSRPMGDGHITLIVADLTDGDLADSDEDPVVLTGIGVKGAARHMTQVTVVATRDPIDALRTCLHSVGDAEVSSRDTMTVLGGPFSTNADLRIDGTLDGDAEGATRSGGGLVTGTQTVPAPAKDLPGDEVFEAYRALATTIPYPGNNVKKFVLSPQSNPWGLTNPDGVYYINTNNKKLTLNGFRLHGTLLIDCGTKKVIINDAVLLQPYRADYPVLIIKGAADIQLSSKTKTLEESTWRTNFNPPGTPFGGVSDTDELDAYPNKIYGLVHVTGDLELKDTTIVEGTILCGSLVTCVDDPAIEHDPYLLDNPPVGYRTTDLKVAPGSWKQVVDP